MVLPCQQFCLLALGKETLDADCSFADELLDLLRLDGIVEIVFVP